MNSMHSKWFIRKGMNDFSAVLNPMRGFVSDYVVFLRSSISLRVAGSYGTRAARWRGWHLADDLKRAPAPGQAPAPAVPTAKLEAEACVYSVSEVYM